MKLPDFIIVGETKCGTTSLYEDMVKHPEIIPSLGNNEEADYNGGKLTLSQKEIRFFDRYWSKGIEWYKNCFPSTDKITGEASPTYLYRSLSMRRIKETLPSIKIIISLRNPIDRLYSHFHHIASIVPKWTGRYPTIEKFLDCAHENDYYIIEKGIYINSIRKCYQLFPPENILIIKSEDFFNSHRKVLKDITNFLGLSPFELTKPSHLRSSSPKSAAGKETKSLLKDFYGPYNKELYSFIGRDMKW